MNREKSCSIRPLLIFFVVSIPRIYLHTHRQTDVSRVRDACVVIFLVVGFRKCVQACLRATVCIKRAVSCDQVTIVVKHEVL